MFHRSLTSHLAAVVLSACCTATVQPSQCVDRPAIYKSIAALKLSDSAGWPDLTKRRILGRDDIRDDVPLRATISGGLCVCCIRYEFRGPNATLSGLSISIEVANGDAKAVCESLVTAIGLTRPKPRPKEQFDTWAEPAGGTRSIAAHVETTPFRRGTSIVYLHVGLYGR